MHNGVSIVGVVGVGVVMLAVVFGVGVGVVGLIGGDGGLIGSGVGSGVDCGAEVCWLRLCSVIVLLVVFVGVSSIPVAVNNPVEGAAGMIAIEVVGVVGVIGLLLFSIVIGSLFVIDAFIIFCAF